MGAMKLTSDVYSVGVLNPNMRIFDVIMKTEYGTSYNAYLIRSDKNVLIETVHPRFYDEYLANIASVIDPSKIDYLIMDHNEPDHSGSIARLLEVAPQLQIISSAAGAIYLRHITNVPGLKVHVARDGETLDLGQGKTLQFISAPFLHWPDSMFTWLASEKMVFTCDFLGAHFCEPRMLDSRISYPQKYETAFQGYFDAIFAPFRSYVLKGLDKLEALDAQTVCTSHGPALTAGCCLESAKEKYRAWSTPVPREHKLIPLFYCSAYNNTLRLAEKIAEGIRSARPDARAEIYDINEHPFDELARLLNESDAFLLGSPTINKDAVLPVWKLACSIDAYHVTGKKCSAFGSFGWSGEAVPMLLDRLRSLKLDVFENGFTCRFIPSGQELGDAFEFGKRFAEQL